MDSIKTQVQLGRNKVIGEKVCEGQKALFILYYSKGLSSLPRCVDLLRNVGSHSKEGERAVHQPQGSLSDGQIGQKSM